MNLIQLWNLKGQILEGIKNKIFTKEHVEDIAKVRMEICEECESFGNTSLDCFVPGTNPCCKICGCCLELKTRALSSDCPKEKWASLMTEEEEDLLNKIL